MTGCTRSAVCREPMPPPSGARPTERPGSAPAMTSSTPSCGRSQRAARAWWPWAGGETRIHRRPSGPPRTAPSGPCRPIPRATSCSRAPTSPRSTGHWSWSAARSWARVAASGRRPTVSTGRSPTCRASRKPTRAPWSTRRTASSPSVPVVSWWMAMPVSSR